MPFKFGLFKQLAHRHVEFIELPSRPRIDSWWCLGNYNIDCLLIGGVGCSFLKNEAFFILQHAIIDSIFYLSTSYDQGFEVQKVLGKKCLWNMGNKFFTTIWIWSSSLGLVIIWAALALHLVMKVEKDSFDCCLVVSKSLLITSTSMLYLYWLWNSRQMLSQLLALALSKLRNHLRAAPVKVFWNISTKSSSVAPRGYMALMYFFKWDFR